MSELDDLERELRAGGDIWFRDDLLVKLHRLIEIARQGEQAISILSAMSQRTIGLGEPDGTATKFEREGIRI